MRRSDWRMDMGATVLGDGVRFRVWAPAARRVDVQLARDGTPLAQTDDGVWEGVVAQARAGSTYRYRLDGAGAYPDPYSRSQPDVLDGSSAIV